MSNESSHIRQFQSLAEAVNFIAECTASSSTIELFNQTVEAEKQVEQYVERHEHFARWTFPPLRRQYEIMDFRIRYKDWAFPADAEKFKLGGHDKELGHMHIDFIKRDKGWVIEDIWQCR
jgi:hypothetical protein